MPVTDAIREALDLKNLSLPASPKVIGLTAEDLTDMDGEASLRITVLIDDNTDLDNIDGKSVGDIKAEIRRSLEEHGSSLFAYIFFAMPSELAEEARGEA
jgi:hypothetical protein